MRGEPREEVVRCQCTNRILRNVPTEQLLELAGDEEVIQNMPATLTELRDFLGKCVKHTPEYRDKQMHALPPLVEVERVPFIRALCRGKGVLDIGASGQLHLEIKEVAREYWGVDHPANDDGSPRPGVFYIDLDHEHSSIPSQVGRKIDLIVCGEVIEHLSNPGRFLGRLRAEYPTQRLVVSVPNAFSAILQHNLRHGYENVHFDHVAWYSPHTLQTLLSRAKYRIRDLFWYNGKPPTSEGVIAVAEPC